VATVSVRPLTRADAPVIAAAFTALGWPGKTVQRYEAYVDQQDVGLRICFLAEIGRSFAGYGTLLWESPYPPFRSAGTPEVSDLNVLPRFRCRGVGSRLLDALEAAAAERSGAVGLGVGLYADYGAAQRLYVRRGYVPDGRGLMYANRPVAPGSEVRVDDDATLMMVRTFEEAEPPLTPRTGPR
jgi:GNAT superfamily N-acetyltransferase